MNNAPWWFALVTALVAGGAAIGAQFVSARLTSKQANERLREELKHEREIERRKMLHDRRFELYQELAVNVYGLERLTAGFDVDTAPGEQERASQVSALFEQSRECTRLYPRLCLVASPAVVIQYSELITAVHTVIDDIHEDSPRYTESTVEMETAQNALVRQMRVDLDATEQLPDSLKSINAGYPYRDLFAEEK